MDLVEGKSLAEVLEGGEPFSQARIIDIALQLSSGFLHAHQHGVLHRDIKPSNVMVSVDDKGLEVAKIVDFGIARLIDQDSHRLTHTGETVGTPYYMSPEQAMGQATDERSDIYSFACLLYEMIYRVPPFTGDNHLAVMTQHLMKEPSAAQREGIDRALIDLVLTCLKKDPKGRCQSFAEVIDGLRSVQEGRPVKPSRRPKQRLILFMLSSWLVLFAWIACWKLIELSRSPQEVPITSAPAPVTAPVAVPQDPVRDRSSGIRALQSFDSLDESGQRLFSQMQYSLARRDFEQALKLSRLTSDQTLLLLEKLALIHHLTGNASEEKQTDERIKQLKQGGRGGADMLRKALMLVSDTAKSNRKEELDSLGSEVLAEGKRLLEGKDLEAAGNLLGAALPRFRHLLGADSIMYVKMQALEAEKLRLEGKADKSLSLSEDCDLKFKGKVSDADFEMNENLVRLSNLYNRDGNYARAEVCAQAVLMHLPQTSSANKTKCLRLSAQLQIAEALYVHGQDQEALAKFGDCVKEAESIGDNRSLEEAVGRMASICQVNRDSETARKLFERLLKGSSDRLQSATYMLQVADLDLRTGVHAGSTTGIELLRQCLAVRQHLLPPGDDAVRYTLNMLLKAYIHLSAGNLTVTPEIEGLAREYVAVTERCHAKFSEQAEALSFLAFIHYRKGEVSKARGCVDRILVIAERNHTVSDAFARWFYDLARNCYPECLEKLQVIFEARLSPSHVPVDSVAYAQFLDDVAHVIGERGDMLKALKFQSRARDVVMKHNPSTLGVEDRYRAAVIIQNYGYFMSVFHRNQEATTAYQCADEYRYLGKMKRE